MGKWDKAKKRYKDWFCQLGVQDWVAKGAKVVCLGAGQGFEVEGFQELGYDAIGIDLVPNPPLVIEGDFQKTPFEDGQFDLVYSNAVDHVYDLGMFSAEVKRITKPTACMMFHLALEQPAVGHEALEIDSVEEFMSFLPEYEILRQLTFDSCLNTGLMLRRRCGEA